MRIEFGKGDTSFELVHYTREFRVRMQSKYRVAGIVASLVDVVVHLRTILVVVELRCMNTVI